jgi:hypothetical protein
MSVMLVTMGSVITHFFWSPLQQSNLPTDGKFVSAPSGRYGRDFESHQSMLRLRYPLWVFASSARASSVAYAENRIRGKVQGWAKQGQPCGSAFRCGVLRGGR